jgi:hypothetical protein|tara:strand:- start:222 stop:527 length:306 start_codon:yes stop_codon:yes gene_type:complete
MALKNNRGLFAELTALAHLAKDPNLLTFQSSGGLGPIDLISVNRKTGEHKYYDVKYASQRKTHKPTHNPRINRSLSDAQRKLPQPVKVEIIYVNDNGQIEF